MKQFLTAAIAGLGIATVVAAAPASAYDTVAYGRYAAGFVAASDIPKPLGSFAPNPSISIGPMYGSWFLCDNAKVPGSKLTASANYATRADDQSDVNVFAYVYGSNVKAERAFRALVKGTGACIGTKTTADTTETGIAYSWTKTVTTGKVPGVTITGVPSVFLSSETTSTNASDAGTSTGGVYTVYTLVNDTILSTQVISPQNSLLSAKQKKAANQLAFEAEGAWVTD